MNRRESIFALVNNLTTETKIALWNEMCNESNPEDYIYENDEYTLSEMFSGPSAVSDALRAAFYGEYKFNDEYVIFNGYGNLESFDSYDADKHIDFNSLVDYLMDYGDDNNNLDDFDLNTLKDDFIDYYQEKTNKELDEDEIYLDCYNFLTTDWDEIIEEINEEMEEN